MEMNIHQGLSELKLLRSRIEKATGCSFSSNPEFIGCSKMSSQNMVSPVGMTIKNYADLAQGNLDSALSLIKRYNAIKSAIVLSNATTKVVIGGNEMTVAEAIERKSTINFKKDLLKTLTQQRRTIHDKVMRHNDKVDADIDAEIDRMNQSQDKRDNIFLTDYRSSQERLRKLEVIDPIKIDAQIEALENEIDSFESEVDHILSTSNAMTKIYVD